MTDSSDLDIIQHVLDGDTQQFARIVKKYQSVVATTAMNMLSDANEAEEVGQLTFISLYKSLRRFKGNATLKTYITRICINHCLNRLKQRKRAYKRNVSLDHERLALKANVDGQADFETKELINQALSLLDVKHRTVVVLRMIQGYSTTEAANILRIPQGTVLSRLKRGMGKLETILKTELNYNNE